METGESGVNGARAQRHANRENNQGSGCVIIQLQDMAGRNARVHQVKSKPALKMFHVQVINFKVGLTKSDRYPFPQE